MNWKDWAWFLFCVLLVAGGQAAHLRAIDEGGCINGNAERYSMETACRAF